MKPKRSVELSGVRWLERAAVAAEVAGEIKGLWKLLK